MSGEKRDQDGETRRYKWRYGPLRLLLPWISIGLGVALLVKGGIDLRDSGESLFLYLGGGLIVLGIAFIFIYRWMAKRGI